MRKLRAPHRLGAVLALALAWPALAGYRNISSDTPAPSSDGATTAHWRAEVMRADGRRLAPANRAGRLDPIDLNAREVVEVTLTLPGLPEGIGIFAYTVNGGRVNGKITDSLQVGPGGKVSFTFQAGRYFGDYPVVLRYAGREEVLTFWVRQAHFDEAGGEGQ